MGIFWWINQQGVTPTEEETPGELGGSRTVGVFAPILLNKKFEQEISATRKFARPKTKAVLVEFSSEIKGNAHFVKPVQFTYEGKRTIALHYSQVLRDDRELIELVELGIL